MARMFARAQSTQRYSRRRPFICIVHPMGRPPGAHGRVRPHIEHVREVAGFSRGGAALFALGTGPSIPRGRLPPTGPGAGTPADKPENALPDGP